MPPGYATDLSSQTLRICLTLAPDSKSSSGIMKILLSLDECYSFFRSFRGDEEVALGFFSGRVQDLEISEEDEI